MDRTRGPLMIVGVMFTVAALASAEARSGGIATSVGYTWSAGTPRVNRRDVAFQVSVRGVVRVGIARIDETGGAAALPEDQKGSAFIFNPRHGASSSICPRTASRSL